MKSGGLFGLSNRFSDPIKCIVFRDYVNEPMSAYEKICSLELIKNVAFLLF